MYIYIHMYIHIYIDMYSTEIPGDVLFHRMDPPNLLNLVRKSKISQICGGGFLFNDIWGAQQLRTGCLSILMFLAPLAEVTP